MILFIEIIFLSSISLLVCFDFIIVFYISRVFVFEIFLLIDQILCLLGLLRTKERTRELVFAFFLVLGGRAL